MWYFHQRDGISIERKAQIDVVSDFLEQAEGLLNSKDVHPGAPAVIIVSVLEEFLKNWVEERGLELNGNEPGIDSYAKALRRAGLISGQDMEDILCWTGLREDAARGKWDKLNDKNKISIMLAGVDEFMGKYGPAKI